MGEQARMSCYGLEAACAVYADRKDLTGRSQLFSHWAECRHFLLLHHLNAISMQVQDLSGSQDRFPDSQYPINKGINRPIEFRGLKAQYIYYLAIGLVILLVLFCILYIMGTPVYWSLALILVLATGLFMAVARLSRRFGTHGLKKLLNSKKLPKAIRPVSKDYLASVQLFRKLQAHSQAQSR